MHFDKMFPTPGAGDIEERVGTVVFRKHGTMASEKFDKNTYRETDRLMFKTVFVGNERASTFQVQTRNVGQCPT